MTSKETTRKLSESSSVASLRRIVYVCIVIATVSLTAVCVQSYWIAKKLNALEERGRVVVNKEDSSLGLIRNAQHDVRDKRAEPCPCPKGEKGEKGKRGANGMNGHNGHPGTKGEKGISGLGQKGQKGDRGPNGPPGLCSASLCNEKGAEEPKAEKTEQCEVQSTIAYAKLFLGSSGSRKINLNHNANVDWENPDANPNAKVIGINKRNEYLHITVSGIYAIHAQIAYVPIVGVQIALNIQIDKTPVSRQCGPPTNASLCTEEKGCLYKNSLSVSYTGFVAKDSVVTIVIGYICPTCTFYSTRNIFVEAHVPATQLNIVLLNEVSVVDWKWKSTTKQAVKCVTRTTTRASAHMLGNGKKIQIHPRELLTHWANVSLVGDMRYTNGSIVVLQSGIYYTYHQMHYHMPYSRTPIAHHTTVNGQRKLTSVHEQTILKGTFSQSGTLQLQAEDKVQVEVTGTNVRLIMGKTTSFFGIFRLD
ncbi:uncharacterized protein [Oscarella lobularis]|uniref:uncharacterized protein isoform X2 n=1 Tax=Oscarella lobularis TaxID=121494 RepID=UPI00331415D0